MRRAKGAAHHLVWAWLWLFTGCGGGDAQPTPSRADTGARAEGLRCESQLATL